MTFANKVIIGLLTAILLLLVLQMAGVFKSGSSSSSAREAARQSIQAPNPNAAINNAAQAQAQQPAAPPVPTGPTTSMSFDQEAFDFGTIEDGEVVSKTFNFTNTGKEDLIISNAQGSCGCTVPSYSKKPIPPGESGEISVRFDSKGKPGKRNQRVTITANTDPAQSFISLTGEVKGGAAAAGQAQVQPAIQPVIQTN